jgi:hypothetical protein
MKRILIFCITLAIASTLWGQGKLIRSSSDKAPIWIKRNVEKYEIVKISALSTISLNDAKQKAFDQLKTDVITLTTRYMLSISINGDESSIRRHITDSQFIKNISESSAIDTYWEERFIRRDDTTNYHYYILYNFNEFEMKKIALEVGKETSSTQKLIDEL